MRILRNNSILDENSKLMKTRIHAISLRSFFFIDVRQFLLKITLPVPKSFRSKLVCYNKIVLHIFTAHEFLFALPAC